MRNQVRSAECLTDWWVFGADAGCTGIRIKNPTVCQEKQKQTSLAANSTTTSGKTEPVTWKPRREGAGIIQGEDQLGVPSAWQTFWIVSADAGCAGIRTNNPTVCQKKQEHRSLAANPNNHKRRRQSWRHGSHGERMLGLPIHIYLWDSTQPDFGWFLSRNYMLLDALCMNVEERERDRGERERRYGNTMF